MDCLEYNAVLCSLMDQVPNLYANDEIEVVSTVSCGGSTGPKGQKFGCAGAATIVHKYRQATKKEVVEHKLSKFRESLTNVTQRLAQPISHEVGVAVTTLENVVVLVVKLLEFHSRDSRSGHFCKFLLLSLNLLCFFSTRPGLTFRVFFESFIVLLPDLDLASSALSGTKEKHRQVDPLT